MNDDGLTVEKATANADRDVIVLGIAIAAILLFAALGGRVLPQAIDALVTGGEGPDYLLVNALLLNVALVIFGWRRYRELRAEIDERRRAEEQARKLAEEDPLTGCLNRRSMEATSTTLRQAARANGRALAFCMIDLDNFKRINDLHGHAIGDAVLVDLARRIGAKLPHSARLARLGGDEFGFIVDFDPDQTNHIDGLIACLYAEISRPFVHADLSIDASISIGVASDHDDHGPDPLTGIGTLMQRADIAMYHAKKHGRNRYFWFEPQMATELRDRNALEIGIRAGLAAGEFSPRFEQQVDLDSGRVTGFEMLARWHSETLGDVAPEVFVPLAEDVGVIGELSENLLHEAFVEAGRWHPDLTLAVNISPVQLRDPWFAQGILKMLVEHNFPPHRLEIEITESCLHEDMAMVRATLDSLRNQGVQISIDDFGTGYSSLDQLRSLHFDRIKIDRSFLSELSDPSGNSQILDAIISLGRGLDLQIIVEGVEDEETLGILKEIGGLKAQGYLFGEPETATEVSERLGRSGLLARSATLVQDGDEPRERAFAANAGQSVTRP